MPFIDSFRCPHKHAPMGSSMHSLFLQCISLLCSANFASLATQSCCSMTTYFLWMPFCEYRHTNLNAATSTNRSLCLQSFGRPPMSLMSSMHPLS